LFDWDKRKKKDLAVWTDLEPADLHDGVDRTIRHETLACTISASGDASCPLVIASNRRVLGILEKGIRPDIDLKIAIQTSLYITTELFGQYVHEVFIPSVKSNREMPACQGKPAILVLDNVMAHCSGQ
jgi:hypothetical protein